MINLPVISNLLLQILLHLNVYISCLWAVAYGLYIIANLTKFFTSHGIFLIIAYIFGVLTEYWRLYSGYSANLKDKLADFSVFFILSPLIQMPILFFLFLFFLTSSVILKVFTLTLFVCMVLELIMGLYAWHKLSKRQAELFQLKLPEMLKKQNIATRK